MTEGKTRLYESWDLNTRLFHWINVLCILLLSFLGLVMLNKGSIGISGTEASVGLKTLHVMVGYLFVTNLIIRIIWGFVGSEHSRWSNLFPGRNFRRELGAYRDSVAAGKPLTYIGHNPKGRLAVLAMFLLMTVMMVTGLVRAGTDIYFPPFGQLAAIHVAAEGVSPADIKPYDDTGTDPQKMAELEAFKKPYGTVHIYTAYVFWLLILLHVTVVIRTEARGEGTLISAMFSGKKHLPREPADG